MVLEDFEVGLRLLHVVFHVLLVEGVAANERTEPAAEVREELGVGEGHPAEDGGVVLLGLAEEGGLLVLGGDFTYYQLVPVIIANSIVSKWERRRCQSVNTCLNSSLQTGITVIECRWFITYASQSKITREVEGVLTVDGNSNALAENVAIAALERGNLAQLVQLEVVGADTLGWLGVHDLEFDVVGLGHGEEGGCAWVALFT